MGKRVYLETSVVSYFSSRLSRNATVRMHQEATRGLWPMLAEKYETYVSALVYEEAQRGDPGQARKRLAAIEGFPMLDVDDEARDLAAGIIKAKGIPEEFPEDALHVAVAAANGIEVLLTWNFSHLNNPFIRARIRRIIEEAGYACPEICSPEELLEAEP
jgi:predicted nucleic acid-binding protein